MATSMTARKPRKRTAKGDLPIFANAVSSEEGLTEWNMNFYTERISPDDIVKLWLHLRESARAALPRTTWVQWASGTISKGELQAGVTACITQGGFALHFIVNDMSKSAGEIKP